MVPEAVGPARAVGAAIGHNPRGLSSLTSRLANLDRRVLVALAAGLVVVIVVGTGAAVYAVGRPATTATTFNLKDGARDVALNQPLTLTFDRPTTPAAVAAHFRLTPAVDGALAPAPGGRSYTWTPAAPWADQTTYTVSLDSFRDGKSTVTGGRWRFTTTILPRVVAVTNDAGSAVADGAEQPLGTSLHLAFNTAMNKDATKVLVNGQPGSVSWTDDGRAAVLATKGAGVGPLALTLAAGSADAAGHAVSTAWTLTIDLVFHVDIHTTPLKFPALVQVPNDPTARDQSGLQAADMVFEYVTEGGITRFTAVFTKAPDKIGPVRSGRLISLKLTRHYHGQLFLSGTSEGTFGVLQRDPVPTFFDTQGYYYRAGDRYAPNNLYINADAVAREENGTNIPAYALTTGKPGLTGGAATSSVAVGDHRSSYAFDATTKTYTKTEDGHQFGDASIGQPLRISMLVVLHTRITTTSIIEDVNGVHGLDFDLDGTGNAEIYYQGARYDVRWSSPDRASPLVFTTASGQAVALPAGLVWVDVVS